MNQAPNNRHNTRARKHPDSVKRSAGASYGTGAPRVPQKESGRQYGTVDGQRDSYYQSGIDRRERSRAESARGQGAVAPARQVASLTPDQRRKLERKEARQREMALAEAKWQKDVVRVLGGPDLLMLAIILILLALGTVMVYSTSYPRAIREGLESNYYIKKQFFNLLVGGVAMALATVVPIRWYKKWAPIIVFVIASVLLAYTAVFGLAEGEAVRWVRLGPISLQPSEIMKIGLILMLAWYAEKYEDRMKDLSRGLHSYGWNTFFPLVIMGIACGLVMVGKHLSGTLILGAIGFFTLVVAGSRLLWLLETLIPVGVVAVGGYLLMNPYALKRITSFTDENADVLSDVWQTTQSVYAIGSGGLMGIGLGQSNQKFGYLGNAHTDFIFSIWCEEFGFIGAVLLIALYVLFIWRGYTIAIKAPDRFTMLTAFGITTHVGLQAFLNMCVAADIIMNTGITLPFFSYGGSSLIVLMAEMGVLLCISRQSYMKKSDLEREELRIRAGLD